MWRLLIQFVCVLCVVDARGNTALMFACYICSRDVVDRVLDLGANKNLKNKDGHDAGWFANNNMYYGTGSSNLPSKRSEFEDWSEAALHKKMDTIAKMV